MNDEQVWLVFTKSKPLAGCSIDIDGGEFYFAEVFVPLQSGETFIDIFHRVKAALLESRMDLFDVSKCIRYVAQEWSEKTSMNDAIHKQVQKALASGKVVIGGFRSEEIEADCCYRHTVIELDI